MSALANFYATLEAIREKILNFPDGISTSAKQDAGNTSLASIDTKTPSKGAAAISGSTPVNIASDQYVPVVGILASSTASFTRPGDTNAYAVGDIVSNSTSSTTPMTFASVARANGGSGYITKIRVATGTPGLTPVLRLHVFKVNNPTVAVDNAAFSTTVSDDANKIGYSDLPAMVGSGAGSETCETNIKFPYILAGGTTSMYGFLETRSAFTPGNAGVFNVALTLDQN